MTRHNRRVRADVPELPLSGSRAQNITLAMMRAAFVVVGLVGISLLTASGWRAFVAIDALKLTTVEVRGAHRARKEALLGAAGTDYGAPLMTIDLQQAAGNMTQHPWVRSATLRRQLPNRLHIDVQEHSPKALLMAERLWVVNTLAEPFKPFASDDGFSLPILTGIVPDADEASSPPQEPLSGQKMTASMMAPEPPKLDDRQQRALKNGLELLDAVHALYGPSLVVEQLHVDEDLGFSLYARPMGPMFPAPPDATEHRPIVVHLGPTPSNRVAIIGETMRRLITMHVAPAVIWANGQRAPNRVQVQPHADFAKMSMKGEEK